MQVFNIQKSIYIDGITPNEQNFCIHGLRFLRSFAHRFDFQDKSISGFLGSLNLTLALDLMKSRNFMISE